MRKISIILFFVFISVLSYGQNIRGNSLWTHTTVGHDTSYTATGTEDVGDAYFDKTDRTISVALGNGVIMQVNQETLIQVYNNTSDTIKNGRVCYGSGIENGLVSIALASKNERYGALLISTEDILPTSKGLAVELAGKVRDVELTGVTVGPIYLDTLGLVSNSQGVFPDYNYQLGAIAETSAGFGTVQFRSDGVNFYNSIRDAFDGAIRETFDFRTFSDGGSVYGVLSNPTGANSLTLVYSDGWYDFTVPDTIELTQGTATVPQIQYVSIDAATRSLQVSTGGYPTDEHSKVATLVIQDAATVQAYGALRNQNINDHFKSDNDNGHILHMAERIRVMNSEWESGTAGSLSGTPTNVYIDVTGGMIWQMHLQSFAAQTMSTGDDIHVVNDPTTPYRETTNLNDITVYSDGSTWNNNWSNIVVWGVCNKTGEISHIMCNLPSDGYLQESDAIEDRNNYSNYTIPRIFRGVGFLIGRFTIRKSGSNFTYNSGTGYLDLRGYIPNNTAGGGTGSSGITDYTQLDDTPSSLIALAFQRGSADGTALENVLAGDILLTEFDSTGFKVDTSQVNGLEVFRTDIDQNSTDISAIQGDYIINRLTPTQTADINISGIGLFGDQLKTSEYLTIDESYSDDVWNHFSLQFRGGYTRFRIGTDLSFNIDLFDTPSPINALKMDVDGNTDFYGDLTANNLSGTNTGDQDISGIAINADSIAQHRIDIDQNTDDISTLDNTAVKTANSISPIAGNVDVTNATTGYLPYKNDSGVFADAPLTYDGSELRLLSQFDLAAKALVDADYIYSGTTPSLTDAYIRWANGIIYNVKTGNKHQFRVNNNEVATIDNLGNMAATGTVTHNSSLGNGLDYSATLGDIESGDIDIDGLTLSYNGTDILEIISDSVAGGGGGTVASVSAGNGMDFTTITTSGSVTMGTPSTLTSSTTNSVTVTSHTHAVTGLSSYGTSGQIPYTNTTADDFLYTANLRISGTDLDVGYRIDGTEADFSNRILLGAPTSIRLYGGTGQVEAKSLVGIEQESLTYTVDGGSFWVNSSDHLPYFTTSTNSEYSIDVTTTSDFWKKKDFRPIHSPLDKVLQLNTYAFNWKEDVPSTPPNSAINIVVNDDANSRDATGVIAQEIERIMPEVVKTMPSSGYKAVDYKAIVPYLIEAIKEQQKQIEELRQLINEK